MTLIDIKNQIDNKLRENLYSEIKQIYVQKRIEQILKTENYRFLDSSARASLLQKKKGEFFKSFEPNLLSFYSLFGLFALVEREKKIRAFEADTIIRITVDYMYKNQDFFVTYPTTFCEGMEKEIEDCVKDIKNAKRHYVSNYIQRQHTERPPKEPFVNATLKYSAFYLLNFKPDYTTNLMQKLYNANLITNPMTQGWHIDDYIIEDIIDTLLRQFKEEAVLLYPRTFIDRKVDRTSEAIRPVKIANFPKNLMNTNEFKSIKLNSPQEGKDLQKLYELIFYFTLSTQMKNSIYDTSLIEITAGKRILRQTANYPIDGEENWELLAGEFVKKLNKNAEIEVGQTIKLPEVMYEDDVSLVNIRVTKREARRPPRYGIGRFVTQILEANGYGNNGEHDEIIKSLLDSKAVTLNGNMLVPTEAGIFIIDWIDKYVENFLTTDGLSKIEHQILDALSEEDGFGIDNILNELNAQISNSFIAAGYEKRENQPSQKKIAFVKAIANKNNLQLDDSIYTSNYKMDLIISQYGQVEDTLIGACPACGKEVHKREFTNKDSGEITYSFRCENNSRDNKICTFSISEYSVKKFFQEKGMNLFSITDVADTIKKILSKKRGYVFTDLKDFNQRTYELNVSFSQYTDKKDGKIKWFLNSKSNNTKASNSAKRPIMPINN